MKVRLKDCKLSKRMIKTCGKSINLKLHKGVFHEDLKKVMQFQFTKKNYSFILYLVNILNN